MSNSIFRKNNIDRVDSPEQLNDYVRVTSPAIWLLITAIIALLAGACIWGTFGLIQRTIHLTSYVKDNAAYAFVPDSEIGQVDTGMTLVVGDTRCTITAVSESAMQIQYYMNELFGKDAGAENQIEDPSKMVWRITADTDLPNGMYASQIIVEQVHPISFLTN